MVRGPNQDQSGSAVGKLQAVAKAIAALDGTTAAAQKASAAFADAAVALALLKQACRDGADALDHAANDIANDYVGKLTSKTLSDAASAMRQRAKVYETVAGLLAKTSAVDLDAAFQIQRAILAMPGEDQVSLYSLTMLPLPAGPLDDALSAEVAARIAYPDGTLRMLRTMEWAFLRHWWPRLAWFQARLARYLKPLLVDLFLSTFLDGLDRVLRGTQTNAQIGWVKGTSSGAQQPASLTFDSNRPAPVGARYLQLAAAPEGHAWDLTGVAPGQVVYVDGPRRTLAVLLGDSSTTGVRNQQSKRPELLQRLQITPLMVSTSKGAGQGDTPGMISSGTLTAGPLDTPPFTAGDLQAGTIAGRPQDDGLVQATIALWSRLCLLRGTANVATVPSFLPQGKPIPLGLGGAPDPMTPVISPHDRTLVVTIDALRDAGLDPDGASAPVIARPGELLLVRGRSPPPPGAPPGTKDYLWQGVVEVVSIVRTTTDHLSDDPIVPALGTQVCCNQPGTVIAIQVLDTPFPVPLVSAFLHRNFQGFGAPALATGVLLPQAVDAPAVDPLDANVADPSAVGDLDRGLELKAACDVLSQWMWPPS
jgi:hypothetical protein